MSKALFICASSVLLISCSNWSGKPNPHLTGGDDQAQLTLASGLFEHCGHFDNAAVQQEDLGAVLAAAAIQKVAALAADQLASAINKVAENRNKAYNLKGNNADWLYKAGSDPSAIQRCLVVVAGVRQARPQPCKDTTSDWYKQLREPDGCAVSQISQAMQTWGIEKPALYAEILLYSPEPAAPNYVIPKLVYSYYPEPLSSHQARDLSNTLLTVKASPPGDAQQPAFNFAFTNKELAPGKQLIVASNDEALKAAQGTGKWLIMPGTLAPKSTDGKGGALNLETELTETPEPNTIIAMANDIVRDKKTEITDTIDARLSYALLSDYRAKQRATEAQTEAASDLATLTACTAVETSLAEVAAAKANMVKDSGNAALVRAYMASCVTLGQNQSKAKSQWQASSYHRAPAYCFNSTLADEVSSACQ